VSRTASAGRSSESTARLLSVRHERGRRVAELAFVDYGYSVWYRVEVDLETRRALRATLATPENRIEDVYSAFDARAEIHPPPA
jgi:hypothetical protein